MSSHSIPRKKRVNPVSKKKSKARYQYNPIVQRWALKTKPAAITKLNEDHLAFIAFWQQADSLDEVTKQFKITPYKAHHIRQCIAAYGVTLKPFR